MHLNYSRDPRRQSVSQEISSDADGSHREEPQGRIRISLDRNETVLEVWEEEAGRVKQYRAGTETESLNKFSSSH